MKENWQKKVCIISDNEYLCNEIEKIRKQNKLKYLFEYFYSSTNKKVWSPKDYKINPIKLKDEDESFYSKYDLFISAHCKQIFPDELVNNHRCINVHPGLNPYNRGWFPQVFSIINKKPVGVTIHEIDNQLDHGPILYSKSVQIFDHEVSSDVYKRILETEVQLLEEHLVDIIEGNYVTRLPGDEGNVNYKQDFNNLCELDLSKTMKVGEVLDLLRATTFTGYDNAYFLDKEGNKIYVSINLKVKKDI